LIGVAAAAASLYTAQSKTIIPLRAAAIAANVFAMIYSFLHGTYPTFMLNSVLLPLNA
jgi:CRP/FNR family transcriptional regulator, cyclic AMP receptor protein